MKVVKGNFDFYFFLTVIILLAFGLIMVFSASAPSAMEKYNDSFHFLKRQLLWVVVGVIAMLVVSKIDYRILKNLSPFIFGAAVMLLVLVLFFGREVNGGKRWFFIFGTSFQPSEFAKIALVIFLANSLSKNQNNLKYFWSGLVPYLIIFGIMAALLMLEPHLSATVLMGLTTVILLIVAGAKMRHFFAMLIPASAFGILAFIMNWIKPYQLERITTFMDPSKDPSDTGYQILQSLYAIGSGGLFGLGLGKSRQKFLYLPEPQNDFIFSITSEELGFVGAVLIMLLFGILIWRGLSIAIKAPDTFSSLLVTGLMVLVGLQVIINIAVVTSSIPVTGMPLPFFSYGGTSLLITLTSMGVVLNVSRHIAGSKPKI